MAVVSPKDLTLDERKTYDTFKMDLELDCGVVLKDAFVAYKTYGTLNEAGDNAIVYPTAYSGYHYSSDWLIGPDEGLDPSKYFIIQMNMLGNGLSSSPSNTPPPYDGPRFPKITFQDMIRAQHKVVMSFGVKKIALVTGFSMGGLQSFQWAVSYPDLVERMMPFCGSAVCSPHNYVFLEGPKAALTTDPGFNGGDFTTDLAKGRKAFGRIYAGWALSQGFYREELWRKAGDYKSLEDFLERSWDVAFLRHDPNDLLSMLWTWQHGDVGKTPGFDGDSKKALASIKAKAIVMPCETDLYFPPEDQRREVAAMTSSDVEFRPIPSLWGHRAGGGLNPVDMKFIGDAARELLAK